MKWLFCLPLLCIFAVSACGGGSSPSASPSPSPSSPTQSGQSNNLGPLAVFDDPGTGAVLALGGTGPIHIEDACVTMTLPNGEALLLVWRSAEVRWDENQREITFSSKAVADAAPITIRDGDTITVGGESLQDHVPVTRNLVWLATPQASCEGRQWAVNVLEKSQCDSALPNGDVAFQGRILTSEKQSTGDGHYVVRADVTLERVRAIPAAVPYGIDAYIPGVTLTVVLLDQPRFRTATASSSPATSAATPAAPPATPPASWPTPSQTPDPKSNPRKSALIRG
jgi:hypothetical protein